MKLYKCVLCITLAVAVSARNIFSEEISPVFGYHRRVGIPRAKELQRIEAGNVTERIVGGSNIDISEVPYQAGLVIIVNWSWTSVCGASLISTTRLVTAAHCQFDGENTASYMTVALGTNTLFSGGIRVTTTDVVMHPGWNPTTAANDIAVIRPGMMVPLSNLIQPIALINSPGNDFVGWLALASGFGLTVDGGTISTSQLISAVRVFVITNAECTSIFGTQFVHGTTLCTSGEGGRGTCGGDSGGPLVVRIGAVPSLIGVTSYGAMSGCTVGAPNAFSRVTEYVDWIQSQ